MSYSSFHKNDLKQYGSDRNGKTKANAFHPARNTKDLLLILGIG
jgi:hypothetical protein